jgi:hypothetical protein
MKRLFAIMSIFIFLSCAVDDESGTNPENIEGVWEKISEINSEDFPDLDDENYESVLQFTFLNNNFESYFFIRNTVTDSIIGYNLKFQGNYSTEGNRMELLYDQYNSNTEASDFEDLDELMLVEENVEWSFNFSVKNDELIFDFDPCGPLEYCIGELNFKRI